MGSCGCAEATVIGSGAAAIGKQGASKGRGKGKTKHRENATASTLAGLDSLDGPAGANSGVQMGSLSTTMLAGISVSAQAEARRTRLMAGVSLSAHDKGGLEASILGRATTPGMGLRSDADVATRASAS